MVQGKIIKRLLGQPTNDHISEPAITYDARTTRELQRPDFSQDATHSTGSPLTCVDISPSGNYAVIAGDEVFKTLKIEGPKIEEQTDLRAAIAIPGEGLTDQLKIGAVRWGHGEIDSSIVTASANGRVTIYDLNRIGSGLEVGRIKEHQRQVHKLSINPFRANLLLSASQDGTVRFFDIKAPTGRSNLTFISRAVFKSNADPVRDVTWNPTRGFEFACATVSGTIQHWDTRNQKAPLLKINAHDGACMTLSWHSDGEHIVSGGLDQQCYIWDLSRNAEKRQKPKYSFATPAPVSIVSWRPPSWPSTAQAQRAAQVAVVYDDVNSLKTQKSTVQIWDIARPGLPFKEISSFETSPTALKWQHTDILWTVTREGDFRQSDIAFAPKVIDQRSLSTFDFSPSGEVLILLEERRGRSRHVNSGTSEKPVRARLSMTSQSPSGKLSISRSDSEEDTAGSFLGPKLKPSKKHQRHHNTRSATPLSTTPPSAGDMAAVMKLEESIKVTGPYKPSQTMAIGHAPSAVHRDVFKFLSSAYLQRIAKDLQDAGSAGPKRAPIHERMASIMETFARAAELVGQYRLSQTWKVLSYSISLLLIRRANQATIEEQQTKDRQTWGRHRIRVDKTPTKRSRSKSLVNRKEGHISSITRSIMAEEESTSTMTTPLARPIRDSLILDTTTQKPLPTFDSEVFSLPEAAHSPADQSNFSSRKCSDASAYEAGYDFYDLDAIANTPPTSIVVPPRKAPLRLDGGFPGDGSTAHPGGMLRHDSNESFQMFSTSGDSQLRLSFASDSVGRRFQHKEPSEQYASWESSDPALERQNAESFNSKDSSIPDDSLPPRSGHSNHRSQTPTPFPLEQPSLPSTDESKISENSDTQSEDEIISIHSQDLDSVAESFEAVDLSSPEILDIDFVPQRSDPSFTPAAIDPHLLIPRTITFETQTTSLNAAVMVLLLLPHLLPGTIDELQAPAILCQYQNRLQSMLLFTEAALLRKLSYPTYPTVYGQGQAKWGMDIGYFCQTCRRALRKDEKLEVGKRLLRCERCRTYLDGCTVCRQQEEPEVAELEFDGDETSPGGGKEVKAQPAGKLWWWCQGCGHGGHSVCLRAWHSGPPTLEGSDASDGCCPMEGCLHPCLPGRWRDEWMVGKAAVRDSELSKLVKEGTRGKRVSISGRVRRDDMEIRISRAVEQVRGTLGSGFPVDRKKSVKVVAPGEE
ncbi:hypothetical protein GMDG_04323 [Pseudogymnoascus destructans 20631-21]|uniref:Uncharacterized protein n=1 Tax=Pseudogymnoascus destructans (strain ATCC MYA-4855 / 20631-21) TaxID=658429 RepID=L8GB16_PSED2|nr:hypothetical protein GMDG_04323 [Pseudogymnoascus destructans 20631-21]